MSEQSSSFARQLRKYGIAGLAIHLAGFALGFATIRPVFAGAIDIESGIAVLSPFADLLYGLGLVAAVAVAARAGVPMKYLLVAGAVIGVGIFYKSAPHEFHIASGIGFGVIHNGHIIMGDYFDNHFCSSGRGDVAPLPPQARPAKPGEQS